MPSYYDDASFEYLSFWEKRQYEHLAESVALETLISKIPRRSRKAIIDVGAGFGRLSCVYADKFKKAVLLDPSRKLLGQAKRNLRGRRNFKFVLGSGEKIPFKRKKFDLVLMIRIFHHFKNPKKAFREVFRVLKPGGFFILEYANKTHFKARTRNLLMGHRITYGLEPIDIRSKKNLARRTLPFFNYHPTWVKKMIKNYGFTVVEELSVSNFRSRSFKKLFPLGVLIFLERNLQKILGSFSFGPSIFLLLKKPSSSLPT